MSDIPNLSGKQPRDLLKDLCPLVGIFTTLLGLFLLWYFEGKFWGIWASLIFAGVFVALLSKKLHAKAEHQEMPARCQRALGMIVIAVGAVFAFGIAGVEIIHAGKQLADGNGDEATKYLVRMLDALLLGLVMFLFGKGIYEGILLKISKDGKNHPNDGEHSDAAVSEFKRFLYGAILLNIVVRFFGVVLTDPYNMSWTALVIPISVFLLAAALWFLRHAHGK